MKITILKLKKKTLGNTHAVNFQRDLNIVFDILTMNQVAFTMYQRVRMPNVFHFINKWNIWRLLNKKKKSIGQKHVKNQTLEIWTENHKTRWSVWNSVIYWFINYACTCQGFIHLKNSRYLNASEKRIKLSTRNINFVGRNLFHEKYKTHVHVTAV